MGGKTLIFCISCFAGDVSCLNDDNKLPSKFQINCELHIEFSDADSRNSVNPKNSFNM